MLSSLGSCVVRDDEPQIIIKRGFFSSHLDRRNSLVLVPAVQCQHSVSTASACRIRYIMIQRSTRTHSHRENNSPSLRSGRSIHPTFKRTCVTTTITEVPCTVQKGHVVILVERTNGMASDISRSNIPRRLDAATARRTCVRDKDLDGVKPYKKGVGYTESSKYRGKANHLERILIERHLYSTAYPFRTSVTAATGDASKQASQPIIGTGTT